MRKFLFLFIYFFILSCGNQNEKAEIQSTEETFLTDHEIILTDSDHHDYWKQQFNYSSWNPSKNDIQIVRSTIAKAIDDGHFFMIKDPVYENLLKYHYFQYLPYENKSGEKFIMVNAFCNLHFDHQLASIEIDGEMVDLNLNWTEDLIEADDGGWCYWRMEVNITTRKYFNLQVNGEA